MKFLRDFEKTAPFLVPLRWEKKEQTRVITLLQDQMDEFMAPPSDAGSVRPIDFEDARIQHVEVDVDEQNNLQSTSQHYKAKGLICLQEVNWRTGGQVTGQESSLHAYSAMSALGRLFAALVQKQR